MNRFHRRYCASPKWEKLMLEKLLPDALEGVSLGDNVLELGPGPGLTTLALARTAPRVTAVEIDPELARITRDRTRSCGNVEVVEGDATALPFDDARYSSVVCMTMLHHLHDAAAQDRLFRNVEIDEFRPGKGGGQCDRIQPVPTTDLQRPGRFGRRRVKAVQTRDHGQPVGTCLLEQDRGVGDLVVGCGPGVHSPPLKPEVRPSPSRYRSSR